LSAPDFVPFERLAVLGLGLLGGSTALAARSRGVARQTLGYARRRAPLEAAVAAGTIDRCGDLAAVVRGADLVILGTPIAAMERVLEQAAPHLAPGTIVTDVGSVKGDLSRALPALLPDCVHFVGSHPIAGSHRAGAEHADVDLFVDRCVVVTPIASTDELACQRIEKFWAALGARVVRRDPDAHDVQVAWTSHLPHLLAYAFGHALEHSPPSSSELAGSGFADFTRIAHSGPDLWADILTTNGKALVGPLQQFSESLSRIAHAAEAGDSEALERLLATARDALAEVAAPAAPTGIAPLPEDARSGGTNPEIYAAPDAGAAATQGRQRNQHE
jgi:prephenate dehydrogenase